MRICLVQSSYEGSGHRDELYDALGDPSRYVPAHVHEFEHRFVRKEHEKEDIDAMCTERFDMYMNWMWGGPRDKIAGVEATRYLESKGVIVLTNPSRTLELHQSKKGFYSRAQDAGLLVPAMTGNRFPKFVKYGDSYGSEELSEASVCHSWSEVDARSHHLISLNPEAEIITQDYIVGDEVLVLVFEMGNEVVAWDPIQLVFPDEVLPNEAFLTRNHKFHSLPKGIIKGELVNDKVLISRIKKAAIHAFRVAGMVNGGGWSRVDARIETGTNKIFVIEVNPIPTMFYPKGRAKMDWLIDQSFPGGHTAFFDVLVATKIIQLKQEAEAASEIASIYNIFAPKYVENANKSNFWCVVRETFDQFSWTGSVLDLACGTGMLGAELHKREILAKVTGVDISPEMMNTEDVKNYYDSAHTGMFQEFIMTANEYDHVACFGAMHFLSDVMFSAVMSRMFMIAQKSITFEVDDLSAGYIKGMLDYTSGKVKNSNNLEALQRFAVPRTWKTVLNKRVELYHSPHFNTMVYGHVVRYEKIEGGRSLLEPAEGSKGIMWRISMLFATRLKGSFV